MAGLAAGGRSGPAVRPGDAQQSLLMQRIRTNDPALRMPPAGTPLAASQIQLLATWIDQGAHGLPLQQEAITQPVSFVRDVEPILKGSCYGCHSGRRPKSQLRLDRRAAAMRGGLGGPVIVPGNSADSRLIHRILGKTGEQRMPLGREPLGSRETAILERWIDSGAEWPAVAGDDDAAVEKHWSYNAPKRPAVPTLKSANLVANPIDAFILSKLQENGLSFSPPASREALIRRVSLDLTGLPPTPEAVRVFLEDERPDAYERLVDRLLVSPHFGERLARPWLDYARYADSNGYEKDRPRSIWKYRDWVIDAFNKDLPFDQFTIEQIAGDMLPNATVDQKIATGFHRNTMLTEEGGVDKDEARFEVLVDRVNTTATVWLGSTIGCAQCHNHKYDPFTQRDYYKLMAFLTNSERKLVVEANNTERWVEPELDLPSKDQEKRRGEITAAIARLEQTLGQDTPALQQEQAAWERSVLSAETEWLAPAVELKAAEGGVTLATLDDGSLLAAGVQPQRQKYTVEFTLQPGIVSALRVEALPHEKLPKGGPGTDIYGNFRLSEAKAEVQQADAWRTLEFRTMKVDNGFLRAGSNSSEDAFNLSEPYETPLWSVDASREDQRLARQLVLVLSEPLNIVRPAKLRVVLQMNGVSLGQAIGRFRLSLTGSSNPESVVNTRHSLRPVIERAAAERSEEERKQVAEYFRSAAESLRAQREDLASLKKELKALGIISTLVMQEKPSSDAPAEHVRLRGAFSSKGEQVLADVPAVLNRLPAGVPPNRLGLARWLVSKDNPLTARVTVNRIWALYFGKGIVETEEDFGSQGSAPTHPELLDWLAVEFMESGWRSKHLHRLIVTSNAYRQSSTVTPQHLDLDPGNRLISRGPRIRLEAEMIRDVALAASGLISPKIGGPSVFPYQPSGVWDIPYNNEKWEESKGEDRYRRSIYTFLQRTAMYPSLVTFDMNTREVCSARRIRTNTPLQALTTLNDPVFFEMAKALARRALKEGGPDERSRIEYAFLLTASRKPQPAEVDEIQAWQRRDREYFSSHPLEARVLIGNQKLAGADDVELASWILLANVLLNRDEALTKQ
jgi:hypothetical protein